MPLKAMWDGDAVISIFMTDEDWGRVRSGQRRDRERLRMEDGAPAIAKVSPLGLRFFAHAPGHGLGRTERETVQHLTLKARIAQQSARAGWAVDVESAGRGWVADVLATKGGRRIAFEVQWSHQTEEDYAYRTSRYRDVGIESVWIRRITPGRYVHNGGPNVFDMPIRASDPAEEALVEVLGRDWDTQTVAVEEFVAAVLDKRIQPAGAAVRFWREKCWSSQCARPSTVWVVDGEHPWPKRRVLAREARKFLPYQKAPLAGIDMRTTKGAGRAYDALCCAHCGVVLGDNFIFDHLHRYQWVNTVYMPAEPDDSWLAVGQLVQTARKQIPQRARVAPSLRIRSAVPERSDARAEPLESTGSTAGVVHAPPESTVREDSVQPRAQIWVETCWRDACGRPFTAWAVEGEPPFPKARALARQVQTRVESIDGNPLMTIDIRKHPTWGTPFDAACCPSCGSAAQGDLFFDTAQRLRQKL